MVKELKRPGDPLVSGGAKGLRKRFKVCVADLELAGKNLQLYSLRRGGATELSDRGGWKSVRTARLYIALCKTWPN